MAALNLRSVSFKTLNSLSLRQRQKVFDSQDGRIIFSLLSPTQFASLFPTYYRDAMPDISGFMKALPSSYTQAKQKMYEQQLEQTVSGAKEGRTMGDLDETVRTKITRSYEPNLNDETLPSMKEPPAEFTKEEADAWKRLQNEPLSASSPEAAAFKNLTADKLAESHIEKYVDPKSGQEMYRYNPATHTNEDAVKSLQQGKPSYEYEKGGDVKKGLYSAFIAEGFSPNQARALMGEVSRENSFRPELIFGTHSEQATNAAHGRTNVGMFSWGDPQRHAAFMKFMRDNGGLDENGNLIRNQNTLRLQARFSKQEMQNYAAGKEFLANKDIGTDRAGQLMAKYIGWDIEGKYHNAQGSFERRAAGYAAADSVASSARNEPVKPEGKDNTYTKEQIDAELQRMKTADNEADANAAKRNLTKMRTANDGKNAPEVPAQGQNTTLASSNFKTDSGGWVQPNSKDVYIKPGNEKQCVTLSRAFNNELPNVGTNGWKVSRNDAAIQPGVVVATNMYNSGRASEPKQGFHTGVALTKPDQNGNFWMLDQSSGGPAAVRMQNVNNYNYHGKRSDIQGNYFGIVNGNTKRSTEAIAMALNNPGSMPREVVAQLRKEYEGLKNNPQNVVETDPKKVAAAAQRPISETVPSDTTLRQPQETTTVHVGDTDKKGYAETKPAETKPVEQAAPPPAPNRYKVNQAGFIAAIKNTAEFKSNMLSGLATDSMIVDGFNSDPRVQAAGVKYDPTTGIMHMKNPNDPQVKEIMKDFDTKKFMTPIEEKKKEEAKKVQTKPVEQTPNVQPPVEASVTVNPNPNPPTETTTVNVGDTDKKASAETKPVEPPKPNTTPAEPPKPATPAESPKPTAESKPADAPPPPAQAPEPPKPQQAPPASHAGGGKEKVDGPLSFLDIAPQRGDNTLVSDTGGNQFTMNKDKEVLQVNRNTNVVDIKPTPSATIQSQSKIESDIKPTPSPSSPSNQQAPVATDDRMDNQRQMAMMRGGKQRTTNDMQPSRSDNLIPAALDQSRQILKNPSAMRAFARAGFGETGDVLDGNKHSYGNNNLGQ